MNAMKSKIVCILSLASILQSSLGRDVELGWFIPGSTDGFPDKFVVPGDTAIFTYTANHDVHIHPTMDCDDTGAILVGAQGAGSASYTFTEAEVNTTIFFACDYIQHCEFGQFIRFNVVEEISTMPPSVAPSDMTMSPSAAPSIATMAPTGSPSSSPSGMPVAPTSVIDLAEATGNYETLLGAINTTGVLPTIAAAAPVTIFGPNDAAFASSDGVVGLSTDARIAVLAGHVVVGAFASSDVVAAGCVELTTLAGTQIGVLYDGMNVVVNGITVVEADLVADDGVFHGVDGVILDGSFVPCPTPEPSTSSIPSDMPSLIPSGMPSIVASGSPTVKFALVTSTPTAAPQPTTPQGAREASSATRSAVLAAAVVGFVGMSMV